MQIRNPIETIPYQSIPDKNLVAVKRLGGFQGHLSRMPHRHGFCMLYWATRGAGRHKVDFVTYELPPNRVFFLHKDQVHQVINPPDEGWVIMIHEMFFRLFLEQNPVQDKLGLFQLLNRQPFADLDEGQIGLLDTLVELLQRELTVDQYNPIIHHLLSVIFLKANKDQNPGRYIGRGNDHGEVLQKLKVLIGHHFRSEKQTKFYSNTLGLVARKLNAVALVHTGKRVPELVTDRLLSECEMLLATTGLTIKQIALELGFIDQAHFGSFFRRHKDMTATEFRGTTRTIRRDIHCPLQ